MKPCYIILIVLIFVLPLAGFAQDDTGMLISQIDGNRYYRKNYDKKGRLKSYQTIEVGNISFNTNKIEAKLTVITYDDNNNMKAASQTVLSCDPVQSEVMMGIFPFAGGAANKSLRVEMPKNRKLYPLGWKEKDMMENFSFQLKFEGGSVGFLGTESRVSFNDRKVKQLSDELFLISGKMILKAYVLGIRLSSFEYDYSEEIKNKIGITRQKFIEENGNYFTIERILDR